MAAVTAAPAAAMQLRGAASWEGPSTVMMASVSGHSVPVAVAIAEERLMVTL